MKNTIIDVKKINLLLTIIVAAFIAFTLAIKISLVWPFTTDDSYITLRYAKHLAEGYGIVWNIGEPPIEGYSNFLWMIIESLLFKFGIFPIPVMKIIGVLSLIGMAVFAYLLARIWVPTLVAIAITMFLFGHVGAIFWSVSGLETTFYGLLLTIAVYFFIKGFILVDKNDKHFKKPIALAGIFLALAALTRPEAPVFVILLDVIILGALFVYKNKKQTWFKLLIWFNLSFAVIYMPYFAWRVYYFGALLPNSVACKAKLFNPTNSIDLTVVKEFINDVRVWIIIGIWGLLIATNFFSIIPISIVLANMLIFINADIILYYMERYFVPIIGLLGVSVAVALHNTLNDLKSNRVRLLMLYFIVVIVLINFGYMDNKTLKYMRFYPQSYARRMESRAKLGHWLDKHTTPDDYVMVGDCGAIAYYSNQTKILDAYCLNSKAYPNKDINFSITKYINWILKKKKPKFIVVHAYDKTKLTNLYYYYNLYSILLSNKLFWDKYVPVKRFFANNDILCNWVFARKDTINTLTDIDKSLLQNSVIQQ